MRERSWLSGSIEIPMMQHDQLGLLANRLGAERYQRLIAHLDATLETASADANYGSTACRMLAGSEFFRTLVERQIGWLEDEADLSQPTIDGLLASVNPQNLYDQDEQGVLKSLRILRQRAMLHIVWRSFTSENGLNETLDSMSKLADFVIQSTVSYAEKMVSKRYGEAIGDDTGAIQKLIVVGMGKLGGASSISPQISTSCLSTTSPVIREAVALAQVTKNTSRALRRR